MRSLLPASVSLPNAGPETWAEAPDVEFTCKWDEKWTTILGEETYAVAELDYVSFSLRFWDAFTAPFTYWLDTSEGRFAEYLARVSWDDQTA